MDSDNKDSINPGEATRATFTFPCPYCRRLLEANVEWEGMELDCIYCGKALVVPTAPKATSGDMTNWGNPAQPAPPVIQIVSKGGEEPATPAITILKEREGFFVKNRQWLIPVFCGAALLLLVVSVVATKSKLKREHGAYNFTSSYTPPSSSTTLTPRERQAIGKIMYAMTNVEANKTKLTREIGATTGGDASEILMSMATSVMADHIETEEGWNDCPYEFRRAFKRAYVAIGKSELSKIVEKYGRSTVMDTLKQYKVHANFTKYFIEVMEDNAASIENELKEAQRQMRACLSKYGIGGEEIMKLAMEEFAEKRMSASGLCKELVSGKDYFKLVDDHTAMWDPGGEDPPMVCIVSFDDNGTATLMQDNTFFARENPRISMESLARRLESTFQEANRNDYMTLEEVRNVSARVQNGHLFFGGEITVEPGKVEEKVNRLFRSLNLTRGYMRFF